MKQRIESMCEETIIVFNKNGKLYEINREWEKEREGRALGGGKRKL